MQPLILLGLTAVLALSGCSTLIFRAGQPTLIGDLHHGTATHVVLSNDEGQLFRIARNAIASTRMGGMRTLLWSAASVYGLVLTPIGAIGWAMDEIAFDAVDGQRRGLLDVVDEQEVDGDAGSRP